jgi:Cu/Ag efflux pump CusA
VQGTHAAPLRIGDVAKVTEDDQPLIGDASLDGAPSLMLVVERFPDANTAQVTHDVDEALDAMAPGLSGIDLDANVFRPASYMTAALRHLGVAGLIGALGLVVAVGVLFISWRAVLIPVVAVRCPSCRRPECYTSAVKPHHHDTARPRRSDGGVVDDVVGDVAALRSRQLVPARAGQSRSVMGDLVSVRRGPLLVGLVMAVLVMAPVLAIGGVWNAFSWPLAATYVLTAVTSLLVALIVTPRSPCCYFGMAGRSYAQVPLTAGSAAVPIALPRRPLAGLLWSASPPASWLWGPSWSPGSLRAAPCFPLCRITTSWYGCRGRQARH